MSFISFKRKLSADLERMTSGNHENKNIGYPKSATTFRKLGSTSHSATKPVRRIKSSQINTKQGDFPVTPPPSRREHVQPFLNDRKQCDFTNEDGQISRCSRTRCSNCYPEIYRTFSNIPIESSVRYPMIELLNSRGRLSPRENVAERTLPSIKDQNFAGVNVFDTRNKVVFPSKKNLPGLSYPRNSALLCNSSLENLSTCNYLWRRLGARYDKADRRKERTITLVVSLPKIEMAEPAVTLAYKHGKL